jgi:hypothetical protein
VAALCPQCEGGLECGGSELASQMEVAEEGHGEGVIFIGRGSGVGRGTVGIESVMSGAHLSLWCTSSQGGEAMRRPFPRHRANERLTTFIV